MLQINKFIKSLPYAVWVTEKVEDQIKIVCNNKTFDNMEKECEFSVANPETGVFINNQNAPSKLSISQLLDKVKLKVQIFRISIFGIKIWSNSMLMQWLRTSLFIKSTYRCMFATSNRLVWKIITNRTILYQFSYQQNQVLIWFFSFLTSIKANCKNLEIMTTWTSNTSKTCFLNLTRRVTS